MLAVNEIEEIHPVTLQQIVRLSEQSGKFKLTMRVGKGGAEFKSEHQAIVLTGERFDSLLMMEMGSEQYSKVWICGPPTMTTSIVGLFDKMAISEENYLLV